jgi:hypothetical protein
MIHLFIKLKLLSYLSINHNQIINISYLKYASFILLSFYLFHAFIVQVKNDHFISFFLIFLALYHSKIPHQNNYELMLSMRLFYFKDCILAVILTIL